MGPVREQLMKLAQGYSLEETVNGARLLKRPDGHVITTFGSGVRPKNIPSIVEAEKKRLQATKAQGQDGLRGDQLTALLKCAGRDAREEYLQAQEVAARDAREEYLQALEAAYRE